MNGKNQSAGTRDRPSTYTDIGGTNDGSEHRHTLIYFFVDEEGEN